jgi:hypothetical protein
MKLKTKVTNELSSSVSFTIALCPSELADDAGPFGLLNFKQKQNNEIIKQ